MKTHKKSYGFTLIEILIVITILGILAAAIIPNFIGFDKEARVATTRSNLDTLRGRIALFRAKENRYPKSLDELLTEVYSDAGVERTYLSKLPKELISSPRGNDEFVNKLSKDIMGEEGGWVYITDKADVKINYDTELDKGWEDYEGQNPSTW